MKHRGRRHLGAEPRERRSGFRTVDLNRLAIVSCDGSNDLGDIRSDCAYVAISLGSSEDTPRKTLDLSVLDRPRECAVHGSS